MAQTSSLPESWFEVEPLKGSDADIRAVLRDADHPLVRRVHQTSRDEALLVTEGLRRAHGGHALFTYPAEHGALHAVTMLAIWLGLSGHQLYEDLGPTVTIVRSGFGHRHDQSWHTDSTPWRRPNIMTLLGHLHLAPGYSPPATELLPIAAVEAELLPYGDVLHALRATPIPWRRNFPDRQQFAAPILSFDAPRWVDSVIDDLRVELEPHMAAAIKMLEAVMADLAPVQAVVEPGQLLIFDNRANFHRGPKIGQKLERELARIKLGGSPD